MQEKKENDDHKKRIVNFTWHTKHEMYEYFQGMYRLTKEEIDLEIDKALKTFRLRQGQPIDPKELWQKVGTTMENRLARRNEPTTIFNRKELRDSINSEDR